MELNQVSLPDLSTAWSNYVLVCSADNLFLQHGETGPDNYVVITYAGQPFIFNCKAHQACQPGQIALGKSHRLTINPADGTLPPKVTCAPFSLAERDQIIEAVEVTFSLNLLKAIRETTIQENKLAEHIAATYTGQVLHQGQVIYCLYNNNIPCELRVTQLSVAVTGMIDSTRAGDEQDQSLDFQPARKALLRQGLTAIKVDETTSAEKNHFMKLVKTSDAPAIIAPSFDFMKLGIGALDKEFNQIFRRAFASRLFPPDLIRKLGINHVRGMLLYGPPGTGKTLIARRIGQMLGGKCEPLIVNGPEVLDKYVGVAEEKIRKLFEPAEQDAKDNGDRAELHTIIFDEIDAICKARGSVRNGTGVHDTVVNQLLSKLDGVKSINNILVIGMTNRPDMIDPALLRPGRLEVKIEIGLPDRAGREQILRIHTADMMKNKMCDPNLDFTILSDRTRNMSGAELAGVVTSAASHALYGKLDVKNISLTPEFMKDLSRKRVQVKMFNFEQALEEVKPAFGVAEDDFATYLRSQLLPVGPEFDRVLDTVRGAVQQLKSSATMQVMTVLIDGPPGSGKSTMAARLAVETEFPFIKLVSAEQFVGMDESSKCNVIDKVFTDSYKSPLSLIMLDNLERLMEFVEIGPRFSNVVLQTLMVLIQRLPPKAERKLCIIATTANLPFLKRVGLRQCFGIVSHAPLITKPEQVLNTIRAMGMPVTESDKPRIANFVVGLQRQLAIKHLVMVLEMANRGQGQITFERFQEALIETGLVSPGDMESDSEELKGQN